MPRRGHIIDRGIRWTLTGLLLSLTGCGDATPGYLLHVTRGQMRVLLESRPLEEIRSATTDPVRLQQFAWVDSIRAYAEEVGLQGARSNYTRFYDTDRRPISYNVSASPVDELRAFRWRFPLLGGLPYKGFFDRALAEEEAERLRQQGYDAVVRTVSAYSTLGYFPDPLLSTMLDHGEARLADLLLHELTHATIFTEHHTDFNESTATFVGRQGALNLMRRRYGPAAPEVEAISRRRKESVLFTEFMGGFLDELDSLYALELTREQVLNRRDGLLQGAQHRYRADPLLFGSRFDGFLRWKHVNNARLLSYRRYNRDLQSFEAVFASRGSDLAASLDLFARCADTTDPWDCLSRAARRESD